MRAEIWIMIAMLAGSAAAQPNVVSNGSFESYGATLTGWNSTEGYGWEAGTPTAADGQVFAIIGNLYQDLATIPGQVYQVRYAVAGNPYSQPATLRTFWAGNLVATFLYDTNGHTSDNLGWIYVTNNLLATASTTRLWFDNAAYPNAPGAYLDAVSAIAVDEPPTACVTPSFGIVSWWPGQSNALDAVDGNHGTLVNGASFGNGMVGQAFSFNGINQCVQIPYSSGLAVSNYSIEAWVEPLAQISDPGTQAVLFAQNNGQCQLIARAGVTGLGVRLQFAISPSNYVAVDSTNEMPVGQFSHVAGTWDGTTLRLYLNGTLEAQSTPGVAPMDSGCPFFIGGIYNPATGSCSNVAGFFNGLIDEVSYYRRALSDSEVHFIYTAGSLGKCTVSRAPVITVQPTNRTVYAGVNVTFTANATGDAPLGYQWQFNGTNLANQTTNLLILMNVQPAKAGNYDVWVNNAAGGALSSNALLTILPPPPCVSISSGLVSWWRAENDMVDGWDSNNGAAIPGSPFGFPPVAFAAGKVGQAFSLTSNGILVVDNPSLRLTNGLSIEGWVNPSNSISSGLRTIFAKFDSPNVSQTNSSYYLGTSNGFPLLRVSATGHNTAALIAPQALPAGQWTHMAGTYDGALLRLYTNGALAAQTNYSGGIFPGTADVGIGAVPYQESSWYLPWSGYLDEISVYNRALFDSEIAAIYNADLTGKCLSPPIIAVQPQSQAVPLNEDALFSPSIVGSKPLRYQWRFNGTNLPGAISSRLLLERVQSNLVGNYSVVVTNALGRATSSDAMLTLLPPLSCVTAPTGMVAWWPANNFSNDVVGSNNAHLFSSPINGFSGYTTGKVGQCFSFTNGDADAPSSPQLNFSTNAFSIETWYKTFPTTNLLDPVELFIVQKIFTQQPFPPLLSSSIGYSLLIENGWLGCQLAAPVMPPLSSNSLTFVSSGPDLRDGMFHHLALTIVRNARDGGHLYVDGQVALTFDPTLVRGSLSNSAALIIGDNTLVTPLRSSGPGQRIDELTIYNRALSQAEILAIRQAGSAGKCIPAPNILLQPTNQIVNAGSPATMQVVASGFPTLNYQWTKNGTNVPGGTGSNLVISNATLTDAGAYAVSVSNSGGSVTSVAATLTINRPPLASNIAAATKQNQAMSIPIQKMMFYASDPDGDPLTLSFVSATSTNGGTVARGPTDVTYTPVTGFIGADSFSWSVGDNRGGTGSALVLIQIRPTDQISGNMLPLTSVPGGFQIGFFGIPGRNYTLQRAESVSGPWTTLDSVVVGSDGVGVYFDTNSPPPTAFYRTVYP